MSESRTREADPAGAKAGSGTERQTNWVVRIAVVGIVLVALMLVLGTLWTGRSARSSTEEAVHNVSLFYLRELADRREQVVANNLQNSINNIRIGISLMDENDLKSMASLQDYQARMKKLYDLEKFAFVDQKGLIYTSKGTQKDINEYPFAYRTLNKPEVAIKGVLSDDKKVIIAIPIDPIDFGGEKLTICFMEIDMDVMLRGVSMEAGDSGTTFCNIYTADGVPLSGKVLGGLAEENDLAKTIKRMDFDKGYSGQKLQDDFARGREGVATFRYDGVQITLYYVPIEDTGLMLTYMVRESLIGEQVRSVTDGIVWRSIIQTVLLAIVLLAMFLIMLALTRRSSRLIIEKEKSEAESRIKQEELEQRLALQDQLLEQRREGERLNSMITALASDYRSVYYVNLDTDQGICYQEDPTMEGSIHREDIFDYLGTFEHYGRTYVDEAYREEFLAFIRPENIREALEKERLISCRYLVHHRGVESYEMLRMAGVRHAEDRTDHKIHAVGVGFTNVDREMRETMAKNQALSDALTAAEEASKAKTTFLSNMSHEIRTPMNAIIGLDNILLSDRKITGKTRDRLEQIDNSAKHLLNLINDILDMSRIESGRLVLKEEDFSFPEMLEQINTMISGQCSDKGLKYTCRVDSDMAEHYVGDDMKLRQVIINILGNAVKFTPEGGEITFDTKRIAQFDGQSTIQMTISDTGIGMDQEYLPKIFEAFSQEDSSATSKYGSSGLGLAISKNIVEMMNGNITVESRKGEGTTFRVTVTLRDSEKGKDDSRIRIDPGQMSVLVVDDDPLACEHAHVVLGKLGIAADTAASGEEAIEMARIRHARHQAYNLILVDWKMPRMDGVETTRRIRRITGDESAIIILTAYHWEDILEEASSAGVDSFLSKPIFASSVMEEFHRALRKKQEAGANRKLQIRLEGRRVLMAEDVPINAEIIRMQLGAQKMEVDHAENGRIAVEKFASHPAGYYDAILMDLRMPEMDGLEAAKTIRAMSDHSDAGEIPIIALTANAFDEDVQLSLQAGLNAHLSKPVEPERLLDTLRNLIRD